MPPKDTPAPVLHHRAKTKGYVRGACRAEDGVRKNTKYVSKVKSDHRLALLVHEKWLEDEPEEQESISLRKGLPPLDHAIIKDFLRFHDQSGERRLDPEGRITADSLCTFAEWFFAGFAEVTGNEIPEEDRKEWSRETLTSEGVVVNRKKPKHLFSKTDLDRFNTTFWTADESCFIDPRNKVQTPFAMAVFCWTGTGIGAFFPGVKDKDTAGLRYRDLELVLLHTAIGWKPIYRIDQRWVKNNRDPENIVFGASTSQHGKLLYNDTQFLLACAIADKAIFGVETVEEFWELQIPQGENELILRWNEEAATLPILRNATMALGVTKYPLSQTFFERVVKDILQLSGYFGPATVHAIPRGLGQKLDERYTEVQRFQHLTQKDTRLAGDLDFSTKRLNIITSITSSLSLSFVRQVLLPTCP